MSRCKFSHTLLNNLICRDENRREGGGEGWKKPRYLRHRFGFNDVVTTSQGKEKKRKRRKGNEAIRIWPEYMTGISVHKI